MRIIIPTVRTVAGHVSLSIERLRAIERDECVWNAMETFAMTAGHVRATCICGQHESPVPLTDPETWGRYYDDEDDDR